MKICQGDTVAIIAGKDKGKKGTVLRVLRNENRLIVSGINMVTKHVKKTAETEGRKVRFEHSIHVSNVAAIDPKSGKATRIGYGKDEKGHKVRIARMSGMPLQRVKLDTSKDNAADEAKSTKAGSFWKRGGSKATKEASQRAEEGPAKSTIVHRSAGRGS